MDEYGNFSRPNYEPDLLMFVYENNMSLSLSLSIALSILKVRCMYILYRCILNPYLPTYIHIRMMRLIYKTGSLHKTLRTDSSNDTQPSCKRMTIPMESRYPGTFQQKKLGDI